MLTYFVGDRLALLAVALPFVVFADPTAFAIFAIVTLALVLANPTTLAFLAKVPTVLMDAFAAVSTLFAILFVVNALASPTTFNTVPLVLAVWAIWKYRIAWN